MCPSSEPETDLVQGLNSEQICEGCSRIQNRLFGKRDRARLNKRTERPYTVQVHGSFTLLSECAKNCLPCRVFQRAILLEKCTYRGAQGLRICPETVYASLYGNLLCISIGKDDTKIVEAPVSCKKQSDALSGPLRLSANPTSDHGPSSPLNSLRKWLQECENQHGPSCSNLRWSNQNPTWLIHIQPNNLLRLVPARDLEFVDYVALSYSWGDPEKMDEESWQRVIGNKSRREKMQRRQVGFPLHELSRTIRHSIRIVKELGIEYIWVDSVCIPQGSNWNDEASRMHEVYGNAKFTLVAGAVENATEALLNHGPAWLYSRLPCTLAGYSLETLTPRLDEVRSGRSRVPVSGRAWTLQEERLSPRLVYWCGQMVYWSCSRVQRNELAVEPARQPTDMFTNGPQRFMNLCWHRETEKLLDEWLGVVEDYVQRDFADATDRFPGISGMAVQFYQALTPAGKDVSPREEYLAGLWRGSFARQLGWSVEKAGDPTKNLRAVAPSWSWASLPLCQVIKLCSTCEPAPAFHLQEERICSEAVDALDAVKKGANVKEVRVRGRVRKLVGSMSRKVNWDSVSWKGAHEAEEQYRLPDPSIPVHARNLEDGRILVYEGHTEPLVGQLDYIIPAWKATNDSVHVPDGDESDLVALEVELSTMLLMQVVDEHAGTYRRVGACKGYRRGCFDESAVIWITLV
ncbi:HET-domain-containing protein [Coniochaeta ligniaria NRRL 30616]|uniref:HET-domain-containing protein n=1 Tax=Coniochaeta ligniaria NRRL 30616 TaxID=1408157 RepID=A0A1J7JG75_9PEZI|nr:HET-domain-containing protein [Coniochaeta ligniaria NRRL 30616]